jgi:hypothetical protein
MLLDSANNALELVASGVGANITADFKYKYFVTIGGSAKITVKNIGVDAKIGVQTQPGNPSSDLAPKLSV